jgi:integration host factor subunit alpha|tara:strand:+ start:502 stop:819 length:318 start_codon:yes stop_codon:yes gene_type:complete
MTSKVVTKEIAINHINETIGLSKRESKIFFETMIELIVQNLKKKTQVKILNFGIFRVKNKKARIGRNPKTRVEVMISERNVVTFKVSEFLLNSINSNMNNFDERS